MKRALLLVTCLVASLLPFVAPARAALRHKESAPGQLNFVTINAFQRKTLGVERFTMMHELVRALLSRPAAFDGGGSGYGAAPDVIALQETTPANLDILAHLMRQRSPFRYQIAGSDTAMGTFLINANTVEMVGEPHVWEDPCYVAAAEKDEEYSLHVARGRSYQWLQLVERATGTPFAASSIHFDPGYKSKTGEEGCFERNTEALRAQLEPLTIPTFIAGDFNQRAMESTFECDIEQNSTPRPWYAQLTTPVAGRVYSDTVLDFHRSRGQSMANEWTREQRTSFVPCDLTASHKRNRIDYIFSAGAETAEVHTDHPGWSGGPPGSRNPDYPRYSDHRFIAGRFLLTGPPKPARPRLELDKAGLVHVSWDPSEAPITEWLLYRAIGRSPYGLLARVSPETLTYDDFATEHNERYRYALAAIGENGGQSLESRPIRITVDARGPLVKSHSPWADATRIERRPTIVVRFDEAIDPASVHSQTIKLYRSGNRICGSARQTTRRFVEFETCAKLRKKKTFRVLVSPVTDKLGNRGSFYSWRFTTR